MNETNVMLKVILERIEIMDARGEVFQKDLGKLTEKVEQLGEKFEQLGETVEQLSETVNEIKNTMATKDDIQELHRQYTGLSKIVNYHTLKLSEHGADIFDLQNKQTD